MLPLIAADALDVDVRLVRVAELGVPDNAAWDRLADASASANMFARPWFVRLSLDQFDPAGDVRVAIVRAADGEWLGAVPLVFARRYGRAPLPHWAAWRHANQFVGTPLVRAGNERAFWRALLAHLDHARPGGAALRLFDLPLDDPVNQALFAVVAREDREFHADRTFARAKLDPASGGDQLPAKERRRLGSLRRKLEREVGPVTFEALERGESVANVAAHFLALEHSGWKGRQGCSLHSTESTDRFFRSILDEAARRGALDVLRLVVGGKTIAMSTQFVGPRRAFGFKMAYDEAYASYAPGLLLLDELTRRFGALSVPEVDSCCVPGQQPVSRMWPERRELVEGRVALGGPLRRAAFRALGGLEDWRARARTHHTAEA